jgi:hypothetical protein
MAPTNKVEHGTRTKWQLETKQPNQQSSWMQKVA